MEFTVNTSIPIMFEATEGVEDKRFTKVTIYIAHTNENRNKSYFSKQVLTDAIPSLANIPIVGFIQVDNHNEADFKGHEQRIVVDQDGMSLEYLGRAYGIIPENNNARFEEKEVDGIKREYLVCDGVIWNKFKEAVEIFDRDKIKSQSMELFRDSVEGKLDKNGIFHFSKFKFEAACILGDNITPAMTGSTIEKFSLYTIQDEFKEMISEFNTYYSHLNTHEENGDNVSFETEGGSKMDEKLELIAKFTQLSEDEVNSLKENLDKYSLEELETKLTEMTTVEETPETEESNDEPNVVIEEDAPATEFTLTASQLRQEISNALSKEKYMDKWGYESRAYWYIDHDENRVYCEDVQDKYRTVGINYTMNGDFVVLDLSTKRPVKFIPVDMEDGVEVNFAVVSEERSQFDLAKVKVDTEKEIVDKFQVIKTDLDAKTVELESLKSENQRLLEFKLNTEKEVRQNEIETLFSKFNDLSDEDVKDLREKCNDMSMEILELNLYALRGKKQDDVKNLTQAKKIKEENLVFNLADSINQPQGNKPDWAEIVERYSK